MPTVAISDVRKADNARMAIVFLGNEATFEGQVLEGLSTEYRCLEQNDSMLSPVSGWNPILSNALDILNIPWTRTGDEEK